jgi:hypothetical protein
MSEDPQRLFDVFLSHNSADKPAVRALAKELKKRELTVWLDEEQLAPGRPWQCALEEIIATVRTAAILVARDGVGPWQDKEMHACLAQCVEREIPVIPVLLPGAPTKPELPLFLTEYTWVDLRDGLTEQGLDALCWGITGQKPAPTTEYAVAALELHFARPLYEFNPDKVRGVIGQLADVPRQQILIRRTASTVAVVRHDEEEAMRHIAARLEAPENRRLLDRDLDVTRVVCCSSDGEPVRVLPICPQQKAPVTVITRNEYADLLCDWNGAGPGVLLLYNIELQSFENPAAIARTWGGIAELRNIHKVIIMLPSHKMRRWEKVVAREASDDGFFADKRNHKFFVCECPDAETGKEGHLPPQHVAFALYQRGADVDSPTFHSETIVFILSEPLSELVEPFVPEDHKWWNYHHILRFARDAKIRDGNVTIWKNHFNKLTLRSVARVMKDVEKLRPLEPEVFFDEEHLNLRPGLRKQFARYLTPRNRGAWTPPVIGFADERQGFEIGYVNGDKVIGHCSGVDTVNRMPKVPLVWVGGFTEQQSTRLPELFEGILRNDLITQFFYQVSAPAEYTTLSGYMEDMREVIRYVNAQEHVVHQGQIVLVARSINGLVAPLVAAQDGILDMLGGLILVAPVFDVVKLIDSYRKATGHGYVTVEKAWRCAPGYEASKWEDESNGWLDFFDRRVHLTLLADIVRHASGTFELRGFVDAVGKISQKCPVHVLTSEEDPIVGSEVAVEALKNAASGGGLIRSDNFGMVFIDSKHYPPHQIPRNRYPWHLKTEAMEAKKAMKGILQRMNVPVT